MHQLETTIIGLKSEVEIEKAGFHLDADVHLLHHALIKHVSS